MFYDAPLFGHGLGSFLNRPGEFVHTPEVTNAHNIFLQMLAEIGAIGTIVLVILLIRVLYMDVVLINRLKKMKSDFLPVQIISFSVMVALLADSMVQNPLYSWRIVVFLAFFKGLTLLIQKYIRKELS